MKLGKKRGEIRFGGFDVNVNHFTVNTYTAQIVVRFMNQLRALASSRGIFLHISTFDTPTTSHWLRNESPLQDQNGGGFEKYVFN